MPEINGLLLYVQDAPHRVPPVVQRPNDSAYRNFFFISDRWSGGGAQRLRRKVASASQRIASSVSTTLLTTIAVGIFRCGSTACKALCVTAPPVLDSANLTTWCKPFWATDSSPLINRPRWNGRGLASAAEHSACLGLLPFARRLKPTLRTAPSKAGSPSPDVRLWL